MLAWALTSCTLSFTLVPIPLCNLCDTSKVSRPWSKEMSRDHKEINILSMQEACCEYVTVVLGTEFQDTSKTLPNQCGFRAGRPPPGAAFPLGNTSLSCYAVTSAAECTSGETRVGHTATARHALRRDRLVADIDDGLRRQILRYVGGPFVGVSRWLAWCHARV